MKIEPEEWAAEQSESANWNFQFAFFIFQFSICNLTFLATGENK